MLLKKTALAALVAAALPLTQAQAADYKIDSEGQHAFIQFKISHSATPIFWVTSSSSM